MVNYTEYSGVVYRWCGPLRPDPMPTDVQTAASVLVYIQYALLLPARCRRQISPPQEPPTHRRPTSHPDPIHKPQQQLSSSPTKNAEINPPKRSSSHMPGTRYIVSVIEPGFVRPVRYDIYHWYMYTSRYDISYIPVHDIG